MLKKLVDRFLNKFIPYEKVDLGLPSGILWANMNAGAEKETDVGPSYFWGTTEGAKLRPEIGDHPYKTFRAPDVVCDKRIRDVATEVMGGSWYTPSEEDIEELIRYSEVEWVRNFKCTGVAGMIFRSKINRNEIFFPNIENYSDVNDPDKIHDFYLTIWGCTLRPYVADRTNVTGLWSMVRVNIKSNEILRTSLATTDFTVDRCMPIRGVCKPYK